MREDPLQRQRIEPFADGREDHDVCLRPQLHALRELPESYRRTVAMRYFGGLTGPEIAQIEGVDAGTIRWRIHEANKRLWALLAPAVGEEGDDGAGQDGELRIAP